MSEKFPNSSPRCPAPLDPAILADYWTGVLPDAELDSVEEHLLSCDACGNTLRRIIALADAIRALAREGSLRMIVSESFLNRAAATGSRIRRYVLPPNGSVQCTVTENDDLLIGQLAVDLTGAARVDLCIYDPQGTQRGRLQDIPINPALGNVVYQESATFAKASPTLSMTIRLVAVDPSGSDRLLSQYTFNHTRTLPGPGTPVEELFG